MESLNPYGNPELCPVEFGVGYCTSCCITSAPPSVVPTAKPTTAPDSDGPIHRYSFNDGTADDSIAGLDATLQSGAAVKDGKVYLSSSLSSYVQLPGGILGTTSSITIETWLTTGSNYGGWARVCQIGAVINDNWNSIVMSRDNNHGNIFGEETFAASTAFQTYTTTAFDNQESDVHFVYTFSTNSATGIQTIALYINGALSVTGTTTLTLPSSKGGGYLGKSFYQPDPYLNGAIDEFRIWKTALSAAQVAQNYKSGPNAIVIVSVADV
jgi:hypothetical protein